MAHEDADSLSRTSTYYTYIVRAACCGFYTSLNSFEGGSSLAGGNLCTYLLVVLTLHRVWCKKKDGRFT